MTVPIPSRVSPLPGWSGPILPHGGTEVGGSDMMVTPGSKQPIVSITNGTVVFTSTEATAPNSGGNAIEIKGSDGLYYYYAHMLAAPAFAIGNSIKTGQQIGIVDSSGNASPNAPHLHIGVGHSISEGIGAKGGIGLGFNAVALLKDLQARANIPELGTPQGQQQVAGNQGSGTIVVDSPQSPVSVSLDDRIRWLAQLLKDAGVSDSQIPIMVSISLAENGSSNPSAVSATGDYGLWQINWNTWKTSLAAIGVSSPEDLKDPLKNAQAAAIVLSSPQGLRSWVTYQLGIQEQFFQPVTQALSGVTLTPSPGSPAATGNTPTASQGCADGCPTWTINEQFGIHIPDLGCVFACTVGQLIDEWKKRWLDWWNQEIYVKLFNFGFLLAGVIAAIIGLSKLVGENPQVQNAVKLGATMA